MSEVTEAIQRLPRLARLLLKLKQHKTHHSGAVLSRQEVDDLWYLIETLRHAKR